MMKMLGCALSIEKYGNFLSAAVLPNSTSSLRMHIMYTSKRNEENVWVRVIYRKNSSFLSAAVLPNSTSSWRMHIMYTSKRN
jgi:hypothetical protein